MGFPLLFWGEGSRGSHIGYLTVVIHGQLTQAKTRVFRRADEDTEQLCLTVNRAACRSLFVGMKDLHT